MKSVEVPLITIRFRPDDATQERTYGCGTCQVRLGPAILRAFAVSIEYPPGAGAGSERKITTEQDAQGWLAAHGLPIPLAWGLVHSAGTARLPEPAPSARSAGKVEARKREFEGKRKARR